MGDSNTCNSPANHKQAKVLQEREEIRPAEAEGRLYQAEIAE
jgi:hypothetical protein